MRKKFRLSKPQKRLLPLILLILILLAAGLYLLFIKKGTNTIPSKNNPVASDSSQKKGLPITTSGSSSPKTPSSEGTPSTSTELLAPFGSFVSTHKPTLYTNEESICNTSPGATCYIQFTKGTLTKKLDPQTVGDSGVVSWTWQVSQAGLNSGNWQVSAVASLNGQTKTTNDQIPLEVQP